MANHSSCISPDAPAGPRVFGLGTGRATERGRVGGGPGAREREGYPRPQGGRGGGGGTPRSQQAEEQAEDFANAGDPWADAQ